MTETVFTSASPVTLLGAGDISPGDLEQALQKAPLLFAADGGADTARILNKHLSAIIGDLDSLNISEYWQKSGTPIHHMRDPNTTDFEKSLQAVDAPGYICTGFLGKRVDHQLAVLHALLKYADRRIVLLGAHDVICLCSGRVEMDLPLGTRVSLFPLQQVTGTHSRGLEWSVNGLMMAPGVQIGTSNRVSASHVEIEFDAPGCLLMLPREMFGVLADHILG